MTTKKSDPNFKELIIFTDGGARGNPGPSGIGVVIYLNDKENRPVDSKDLTIIKEIGKYIGTATNNFAEYTALITALDAAGDLEVKQIRCVLDSELVVKQLKGEYRIKEPTLQKLAQQARDLAEGFDSVTYIHVRREKNKLADLLVNKAIDEHLG